MTQQKSTEYTMLKINIIKSASKQKIKGLTKVCRDRKTTEPREDIE